MRILSPPPPAIQSGGRFGAPARYLDDFFSGIDYRVCAEYRAWLQAAGAVLIGQSCPEGPVVQYLESFRV